MEQSETMQAEGKLEGQKGPRALALVEPGKDEIEVERVNRKLPAGITSKMLYADVLRIAWPSLVELTLTQLTSMVDLMMVGGLGPWAITAVGLSVQPRFLSMLMFVAMNVGATAMVARYRGAGKPRQANEILRQALFLSLILSIIAGALGYVYAERLIAFMGAADPETLAGGTIYLRIQMLTLPIFALTATITAALRGVGHTRVAMVYNIVANVVNVTFNYLLIHGHLGFPRLEVAGASLATSIGQVAAFIMALAV
ncbi:MAG TPA: MATE family efflux transporter, partial [Firmicutes bacterium]|nr:MATE family efflux transporter [Bacillota bacterium]